jgi:hypothetical protein
LTFAFKWKKEMDTQLLTLSKIFTERLFRIPDYQRGYAWKDKQLRDFWNDIQQLEADHNHYTGVLTLEDVSEDIYRHWEDDLWIIEFKSYQPYFVVDGQQRLTTAIILIQTILERTDEVEKLNYTGRADIQRRFIFDSKDDGISRAYVFGYEKDNPSYEFLKTKIFRERSSGGRLEETVYTQNLSRAKQFFSDRVTPLQQSEIEDLYRKVTQQLLFNIFTITEDVDVCVAFETMNNRGKPLSHLELLKNRLIYLSLKFDTVDYERKKLRSAINDCWKALYHNLGKNKNQPLDDDRFLFAHYILYFGRDLISDDEPAGDALRYRRLYRADYSSDLLEKRFVPRNVTSSAPSDEKIELKDVYDYVSSLQDAVELWYKMWNPSDSDFSDDTKIWLDKLARLGMSQSHYLPLLLAFLKPVATEKERVSFLQAVERYIFLLSLINRTAEFVIFFETNSSPLKWAIDLSEGRITAGRVIKELSDMSEYVLKGRGFARGVISRFRGNGFYEWEGIRYLLFEYNLSLQERSKTDRPKIFWPEFTENIKDYITVEHIYPRQARRSYWTSRFKGMSTKQRAALRDSLGNLLPLSKPKNSSLSNRPFPEKVDGKKDHVVGYRYGSYAENEVAKESEWTPAHILRHGLAMLDYMERRWGIELGSGADKKRMLGLDFMSGTKRKKAAGRKRRSAADVQT